MKEKIDCPSESCPSAYCSKKCASHNTKECMEERRGWGVTREGERGSTNLNCRCQTQAWKTYHEPVCVNKPGIIEFYAELEKQVQAVLSFPSLPLSLCSPLHSPLSLLSPSFSTLLLAFSKLTWQYQQKHSPYELYAVSLFGLYIQLAQKCGNPSEAWLAVTGRFYAENYNQICQRESK
jgi:hypothetical protein